MLSACSGDDNSDKNGDPKLKSNTETVSITSPSAGSGLLNAGTLMVKVFVDGNSNAVASSTVDTITDTVKLNVTVAVGSHTFKLIFEYSDPMYGGPFLLAYTDSETVNVTKGSDQTIAFTSTDFIYEDLDNDGFTNLSELHPSRYTDPTDSTCVADKSIMAGALVNGCTLG